MPLPRPVQDKLIALALALIDQRQAAVVVEPYERDNGFWFGGGNVIRDRDGSILVVGRYRNRGDSRTGLRLGERGLECAIWRSPDGLRDYRLVKKWNKADLTCEGREVISIEGTVLHLIPGGVELFVSSEKEMDYPAPYRDAQKPGTGIWSIDRMTGDSVETLDVSTLHNVLSSTLPAHLHVKDPAVVERPGGAMALLFCTHPYCWSSSNTAIAMREGRQDSNTFGRPIWNVLRRGNCWDVAAARVTDVLRVPRLGMLADLSSINLYFYDGAECIHDHGKGGGKLSTGKPRGYSCEEIGGLAWGWEGKFPEMEALSVEAPLFVSPWGTGCSRYVHMLVDEQGILAVWQQSQADLSQPLVAHWLPIDQIERTLT